MQLTFEDMTVPVEAAAASEAGPRTPEQSEADAKAFFSRNHDLMDACLSAGTVANRHGRVASSRQMVELTRAIRQLGGWQNFREFASCFAGIDWERDGDAYAIPNAYSAYLTRALEDGGVDVTKSRSKLDEVMA